MSSAAFSYVHFQDSENLLHAASCVSSTRQWSHRRHQTSVSQISLKWINRRLRAAAGLSRTNIDTPTLNAHELKSRQRFQSIPGDKFDVVPDLEKEKYLLCVSNGHGEDTIAVSILEEVEAVASERGASLKLEALPLVGLGSAYKRAGITTIGPAKAMPSGGFIYMDSKQLVGDVQAGLLSLTLDQWKVIAEWAEGHPTGAILAVGDIFPLALAWLTTWRRRISNGSPTGCCAGYGFVGTAKSEYYLRDQDGKPLERSSQPFLERILAPESVYLPWERALIASSRCRLAVPRDSLTVHFLRKELAPAVRCKVQDLGNPMMDGLEPSKGFGLTSHLGEFSHCLSVLPGSRPPEVYANWRLLLSAAQHVASQLAPAGLLFLSPIVPSLDLEPFIQVLSETGWLSVKTAQGSKGGHLLGQEVGDSWPDSWPTCAEGGTPLLAFELPWADDASTRGVRRPLLVMTRGGFNECVQRCQGGLAMAGTATEQLVGLGKPVFTLPGAGPQFTWAFAEAQSRLLGNSVVMCNSPSSLAAEVPRVLVDKKRLAEITANGQRRMGRPGASRRIALQVWTDLLDG